MDYSSFYPTSSSASYDSQTALSRSLSTFSTYVPIDSFNFQSFDESAFDPNIAFSIDKGPGGLDLSMMSMSNSEMQISTKL